MKKSRLYQVGVIGGVCIGVLLFFVYGHMGASAYTQEQWIEIHPNEFQCDAAHSHCRVEREILPSHHFFIESEEDIEGRVIFFERNTWTTDFQLSLERDAPDHDIGMRASQSFHLDETSRFQIILSRWPQESVFVTAYDRIASQPARRVTRFRIAVNSQPESLAVIPRSEWLGGGDELSQTKSDELWPLQYEQIEKIIIHHTATAIRDVTGDGITNHADYGEAIRALYKSHTHTRGWGDIGYHYIIDPEGYIWEGRRGGDGIVGGHVTRSRACTRFPKAGVGFNKGTIGVALLGTYSVDEASEASLDALSTLIARKAWEFEIDPTKSHFFQDQVYPTVMSHRDVDCTDCPGDQIQKKMPEVILSSHEKLNYYSSVMPRIYHAARVSGAQEIEVRVGEKIEFTLSFRNEGTTTWRNYGHEPMYIAREDVKQRLSSLDSFRIATEKQPLEEKANIQLARTQEPNVRPGEIGTFHISIEEIPQELITKKKFVLALGTRGWLPSGESEIMVMNTGLEWAATLLPENKEQSIRDFEGVKRSIQFQNRGTKTWKQGEVTLFFYNENKKPASLVTKEKEALTFTEKEIKPGESATFEVGLYSEKHGEYVITPELKAGDQILSGSNYEKIRIAVAPSYQAEIVSHSFPPAIRTSWQPTVSVVIKNTGVADWNNPQLSSVKDGKKRSSFAHASWESVSRIDSAKKVVPGDTVTFLFTLKGPAQTGSYKEALRLGDGKRNIQFIKDGIELGGWKYEIRVDPIPKKKAIKKKM